MLRTPWTLIWYTHPHILALDHQKPFMLHELPDEATHSQCNWCNFRIVPQSQLNLFHCGIFNGGSMSCKCNSCGYDWHYGLWHQVIYLVTLPILERLSMSSIHPPWDCFQQLLLLELVCPSSLWLRPHQGPFPWTLRFEKTRNHKLKPLTYHQRMLGTRKTLDQRIPRKNGKSRIQWDFQRTVETTASIQM